MIFDRQTLFSNAQAITATAQSTDQIDTGPIMRQRDIGRGAEIPLRIQVVQAFNNLTSLTIAYQVADDTGFSTNLTTVWSTVVPLASLTAGAVIVPDEVLRGSNRRYHRLFYTVTGTAPTTGQITAGIVMGTQSNE